MPLTTFPSGLCLASCAAVLLAWPAGAQEVKPQPPPSTTLLKNLSASVEALTRQVAPSIVQVLVAGYGPLDQPSGRDNTPVIGRQYSSGSGVIIDGDGYILTNAHVVADATGVEVVFHPEALAHGASPDEDAETTVDARIVGLSREMDLALLKVDVTGLHPLPLADYSSLKQGELVFAFGSPEGLVNSVTMGVVSSVARQPDPDSPAFYIQTDAPINPGNSGGPLVNADGALVGLNTFILSTSGGSQGLGFAIPSAVIGSAYPQLKKYGHLHRAQLGFNTQAITPALSANLGLPRRSGLVVSDLLPGGPADRAGLQIGDVVAAIDGRPVSTAPTLLLELSRYVAGDTVKVSVVRESGTSVLSIKAAERADPMDEMLDRADPDRNAVPKLGIIGVDIPAKALPQLRIPSGVLVAARTELPAGRDVPLSQGDVIHALNGRPVTTLAQLRTLLDTASSPVIVLQIERGGLLMFVTCVIE